MEVTETLAFLRQNHEVANAISAIAGTVIATCAFGVSVLSVYFTRKALKHQQTHNRLSVRPLPYIHVGDYENTVYVKIRNNGTGPLIIERLTILGAEDPHKPLIFNMPELLPSVVWANFAGVIEERSIIVGGELVLLELVADHIDGEFRISRDRVRQALGKLELSLDYTDIYGSIFPNYKRDLKWFHRTVESDA